MILPSRPSGAGDLVRLGALGAVFFAAFAWPWVTAAHGAFGRPGLPLSPVVSVLPLWALLAGLLVLEQRLKRSPEWGDRLLSVWSAVVVFVMLIAPAMLEVMVPLAVGTGLPRSVPLLLSLVPVVLGVLLAGRLPFVTKPPASDGLPRSR